MYKLRWQVLAAVVTALAFAAPADAQPKTGDKTPEAKPPALVRVAEVTAQDVVIEGGKVKAFRTKLSLSFKFEN